MFFNAASVFLNAVSTSQRVAAHRGTTWRIFQLVRDGLEEVTDTDSTPCVRSGVLDTLRCRWRYDAKPEDQQRQNEHDGADHLCFFLFVFTPSENKKNLKEHLAFFFGNGGLGGFAVGTKGMEKGVWIGL